MQRQPASPYTGSFDLSFPQTKMWLASRQPESSVIYNNVAVLKIDGNLDGATFVASVKKVIHRHEALRATFSVHQEKIEQQIGDDMPVSIDVVQLKNASPDQIEKEIDAFCLQPFDLLNGPLFRGRLLQTDAATYLFVLVVHHIVSDGYSFVLFLQDLFAFYNGQQLPDLTVNYRETIQLNNRRLDEGLRSIQENYWRNHLKNGREKLTLTYDYGKSSTKSYKSSHTLFKAVPGQTVAIRQLAISKKTTPFVFLLAVFKVFLSKITQQQNVTTGVTLAGRSVDLEKHIGMFVNTPPVRSALNPEVSFEQYLKELTKTILEVYRYQNFPVEELLSDLTTENDGHSGGLYEAMFLFRQRIGSLKANDLAITQVEYQKKRIQYDLVLEIIEENENYEFKFQYKTDLFGPERIDRFCSSFINILNIVVAEPSVKIGEVELLNNTDRTALLTLADSTRRQYPADTNIVHLFEEQVQINPSKAALVFGSSTLTYEELNRKANQLAHYLKQSGVGPETIVPVCVNRGLDMIVGILGVLKAGGAYAPIDPAYPPDRIKYMLQDTGAQIILTTGVVARILPDLKAMKVIELDTHEHLIGEYAPGNSDEPIAHHQLAYIIYTSGSTGRPKGVMIEHAGLTNLLHNLRETLPLRPGLCMLHTASLSFDASCFEIFASLISGGKLVIAAKNDLLDLALIQDILRTNRVKLAFLPPSYQSIIVDNPFEVEVVSSGGETPNAHVISQLQQKGIKVFNVYGPTESTVAATLTDDPLRDKGRVVIGKPLGNVRIYIVGADGKLLPPGFVGEMYIGGSQTGRGYLNLPQLTDQKFIKNPFDAADTSKVYRSGDLGRWLPDGTLEFMGRIDEQVKIRGHRIELGEIESVVNASGLVKQAAIIVHQDEKGDKALMGFAVGNGAFDSKEIARYLKDRLPDFMIPETWIELPVMPLGPNDKVDKKALAGISLQDSSTAVYKAPETTEEALLASLWEDLLGVATVASDSDFFDLGGNSLKMIRLASEIYKKFGARISLNDFFDNTRLDQQAQLIRGARRGAFSEIPKITAQAHYELSPSQQRLWIIDQLGVNRSSYNSFGIYEQKLGPDFSVELLDETITQLIKRHETLRTVFLKIDGAPRQQILEAAGVAFKTTIIENPRAPSYEAIYNSEFELDRWPLFKIYLVKESDGYQLLHLFHHIIIDGWSLQNFFDECWIIYESLRKGVPPVLAGLPVQYKDYAAWQNQLVADGTFNGQRDYWLSRLGHHLPELRLPFDYDLHDDLVLPEAKYYELYLDEDQKQRITRFIGGRRISLFAFLIGCFKLVLGRLSGQTDIIIGTPVANRNHPDIKGVIGFFLNTLMLRDEIDENSTVAGFLQQVNSTLVNALENQNYPFEKLLEELNVKKSFNQFPISSVFLNMLSFDTAKETTLSDLTARHAEEIQLSKFDLECYFEEYANAIKVICTYRTSLLKASTVETWINGFVHLVEEVLGHPDGKIKNVKIFGPPARQGSQPSPKNRYSYFPDDEVEQTIVARFEKQAEKYPHHIAIRQDGAKTTYQELLYLANGLATRIRQTSGWTSAPIGLLLDHGKPSIAGMLGVLRAGNAYVPIDTTLPQQRIRYMLEDAGCHLIVVNASSMEAAKTLHAELPGIMLIDLDSVKPLHVFEQIVVPDPQSLAYILYTSGSTGQPKGVLQSHRNVLHFIRIYTNNLKISTEDKLSLLPGYGFDSAVMDIYGALLNGATLYPYDIKKNGPGGLSRWLISECLSVIHAVPTIYRSFINELDGETQFKNIRLVVLGGEAVYKLDFDHFKRHFTPGAIFINGYGPTESTITLQRFFDHQSEVTRRAVPIGYPVAATEVYLLDEQDTLLTDSYQIGEIVYKSEYLALGYLNNPEQTARVFTPDPVAPSGRVYRSGDFGRLLPTGEIEFTGRKDTQVKIQGLRVELVEVEHVLRSFAAIDDCLVIIKDDHSFGQKKMVAYYTSGEELSTFQLRKYLHQKLPGSFVPSSFVRLEEIPKTPSGKSNRKALEDLPLNDQSTNQYVAPASPTEKLIAEIWKPILRVEKISLHDDFFSLGGNSLLMIKTMIELKQRTGVQLTIRDFVNQSLSAVAQKCDQEALTVIFLPPELNQ